MFFKYFSASLVNFLNFQFQISVRSISNEFCRIFQLIAYAVPATSAWILVAISLDRYLSIKYPTKLLFRKKPSFQWSVCIGLLAFDILYYAEIYFSYVKTAFTFDNDTNQTVVLSSACVSINDSILGLLS